MLYESAFDVAATCSWEVSDCPNRAACSIRTAVLTADLKVWTPCSYSFRRRTPSKPAMKRRKFSPSLASSSYFGNASRTRVAMAAENTSMGSDGKRTRAVMQERKLVKYVVRPNTSERTVFTFPKSFFSDSGRLSQTVNADPERRDGSKVCFWTDELLLLGIESTATSNLLTHWRKSLPSSPVKTSGSSRRNVAMIHYSHNVGRRMNNFHQTD